MRAGRTGGMDRLILLIQEWIRMHLGFSCERTHIGTIELLTGTSATSDEEEGTSCSYDSYI